MRIVNTIIVICALALSNLAGAQIITTAAGNGIAGDSGDGGIATAAKINIPYGGVFDSYGNYYFVEASSNKVRAFSQSGIINTIAGVGTAGYSGDGGPSTASELRSPQWVTTDLVGNIYISDVGNSRIRKINSAGIISTIAGNGAIGYGGDGGPATAATFAGLGGICVDSLGNVYVSDGSRIRKISSSGIINTIVGNGVVGFAGDGGPATMAQIHAHGIYVRDSGTLFICDFDRIRKVDVGTNIIYTIAGTGLGLFNGDEIHADSANFSSTALAWDHYDNIFIADLGNNRIRKIDSVGIIHTIAGTGVSGYSGDGGLATNAQMYGPSGISFDACGNLLISCKQNQRIRKVSYPPVLTIPPISLGGTSFAPLTATVTIMATVANAGSSYTIHWLNHGIEFATTTVPSVTYTKLPGTDTITARIVPTGVGCWDSTTSAGHTVAVGTTEQVYGSSFIAGMQLWPNPANDALHIELGGATIKGLIISNLPGQILISKEYNNSRVETDISTLPPGVYFVKVIDDQGKKTVTKFIKQ